MKLNRKKNRLKFCESVKISTIGVLIAVLICPFNIFSQNPDKPIKPTRRPRNLPTELPDSIPLSAPLTRPSEVVQDSLSVVGDSVILTPVDTLAIVNSPNLVAIADSMSLPVAPQTKIREFNPDPVRAVWLSALFPGLGQVYNRRFWKLPLVVAGFMGLGYGTSWNNMMLRDYTRAYSDIMDSDPTTNSYMDFFPSTITEDDLDKTWLTNTLKARKDYYRRNRDLCIICMVGVYLLAMVDAYVDASLSHFDITPDLSVQVSPAVISDSRNKLPGIGLAWALNF